MLSTSMTAHERRTAVSLAGIFTLRMLGMFMILPVFALYAEELAGVTPALVGLAIGVYGLTQAILQIPFGMASDRLGRKPVIVFGLLLFAMGSVVAALADSIHGVIIGRALQGAGAVAAAVMALLADLTREEHRTKAMAFIGMSIGLSFVLAMVLGPLLNQWIGVPGIFWLTALLTLAGIAILIWRVPTPQRTCQHRDAEPIAGQFGRVLTDRQLLRLDMSILVLHMVLTASFVTIPLLLRDIGLAAERHWLLYLPVMLLAIALSIPFIVVAEKRHKLKQILLGAAAILGLSEVGIIGMGQGIGMMAVLLLLFFTAFNLLEATLPSLVAKFAPVDAKGTAMGVYSTAQFLGAFIGGVAGGWVHGRWGVNGVFLMCAVAIGGWWLLMLGMRQPSYLASQLLQVGALDATGARELEQSLRRVRGVVEVVVNGVDGVAYLKVDARHLDMAALEAYSVPDS